MTDNENNWLQLLQVDGTFKFLKIVSISALAEDAKLIQIGNFLFLTDKMEFTEDINSIILQTNQL